MVAYIPKQQILTRIKRYKALNQMRLQHALSLMGHESRFCLTVVPVLLHYNHVNLIGYRPNAPYGIDLFSINAEQALYLSRAVSPKAPPLVEPKNCSILGIYAMGSTSSLCQGVGSDLDLWVCTKASLTQDDLEILQNKCRIISEFAKSRGVELNLFVTPEDRFTNFQPDSLDEENCGSAQNFFLLDEFYRTSIRLCGRYILWYLISSEEEHEDYHAYTQFLLKGISGLPNFDKPQVQIASVVDGQATLAVGLASALTSNSTSGGALGLSVGANGHKIKTLAQGQPPSSDQDSGVALTQAQSHAQLHSQSQAYTIASGTLVTPSLLNAPMVEHGLGELIIENQERSQGLNQNAELMPAVLHGEAKEGTLVAQANALVNALSGAQMDLPSGAAAQSRLEAVAGQASMQVGAQGNTQAGEVSGQVGTLNSAPTVEARSAASLNQVSALSTVNEPDLSLVSDPEQAAVVWNDDELKRQWLSPWGGELISSLGGGNWTKWAKHYQEQQAQTHKREIDHAAYTEQDWNETSEDKNTWAKWGAPSPIILLSTKDSVPEVDDVVYKSPYLASSAQASLSAVEMADGTKVSVQIVHDPLSPVDASLGTEIAVGSESVLDLSQTQSEPPASHHAVSSAFVANVPVLKSSSSIQGSPVTPSAVSPEGATPKTLLTSLLTSTTLITEASAPVRQPVAQAPNASVSVSVLPVSQSQAQTQGHDNDQAQAASETGIRAEAPDQILSQAQVDAESEAEFEVNLGLTTSSVTTKLGGVGQLHEDDRNKNKNGAENENGAGILDSSLAIANYNLKNSGAALDRAQGSDLGLSQNLGQGSNLEQMRQTEARQAAGVGRSDKSYWIENPDYINDNASRGKVRRARKQRLSRALSQNTVLGHTAIWLSHSFNPHGMSKRLSRLKSTLSGYTHLSSHTLRAPRYAYMLRPGRHRDYGRYAVQVSSDASAYVLQAELSNAIGTLPVAYPHTWYELPITKESEQYFEKLAFSALAGQTSAFTIEGWQMQEILLTRMPLGPGQVSQFLLDQSSLSIPGLSSAFPVWIKAQAYPRSRLEDAFLVLNEDSLQQTNAAPVGSLFDPQFVIKPTQVTSTSVSEENGLEPGRERGEHDAHGEPGKGTPREHGVLGTQGKGIRGADSAEAVVVVTGAGVLCDSGNNHAETSSYVQPSDLLVGIFDVSAHLSGSEPTIDSVQNSAQTASQAGGDSAVGNAETDGNAGIVGIARAAMASEKAVDSGAEVVQAEFVSGRVSGQSVQSQSQTQASSLGVVKASPVVPVEARGAVEVERLDKLAYASGGALYPENPVLEIVGFMALHTTEHPNWLVISAPSGAVPESYVTSSPLVALSKIFTSENERGVSQHSNLWSYAPSRAVPTSSGLSIGGSGQMVELSLKQTRAHAKAQGPAQFKGRAKVLLHGAGEPTGASMAGAGAALGQGSAGLGRSRTDSSRDGARLDALTDERMVCLNGEIISEFTPQSNFTEESEYSFPHDNFGQSFGSNVVRMLGRLLPRNDSNAVNAEKDRAREKYSEGGPGAFAIMTPGVARNESNFEPVAQSQSQSQTQAQAQANLTALAQVTGLQGSLDGTGLGLSNLSSMAGQGGLSHGALGNSGLSDGGLGNDSLGHGGMGGTDSDVVSITGLTAGVTSQFDPQSSELRQTSDSLTFISAHKDPTGSENTITPSSDGTILGSLKNAFSGEHHKSAHENNLDKSGYVGPNGQVGAMPVGPLGQKSSVGSISTNSNDSGSLSLGRRLVAAVGANPSPFMNGMNLFEPFSSFMQRADAQWANQFALRDSIGEMDEFGDSLLNENGELMDNALRENAALEEQKLEEMVANDAAALRAQQSHQAQRVQQNPALTGAQSNLSASAHPVSAASAYAQAQTQTSAWSQLEDGGRNAGQNFNSDLGDLRGFSGLNSRDGQPTGGNAEFAENNRGLGGPNLPKLKAVEMAGPEMQSVQTGQALEQGASGVRKTADGLGLGLGAAHVQVAAEGAGVFVETGASVRTGAFDERGANGELSQLVGRNGPGKQFDDGVTAGALVSNGHGVSFHEPRHKRATYLNVEDPVQAYLGQLLANPQDFLGTLSGKRNRKVHENSGGSAAKIESSGNLSELSSISSFSAFSSLAPDISGGTENLGGYVGARSQADKSGVVRVAGIELEPNSGQEAVVAVAPPYAMDYQTPNQVTVVPEAKSYVQKCEEWAKQDSWQEHVSPIAENEWFDFGSISRCSPTEYFGSGLWLLYKAIDSPFKVVLKILLMEVYSSDYSHTRLLSSELKDYMMAHDGYALELDAYFLMYLKVANYLQSQRDPRLTLVRKCFYLKIYMGISQKQRYNHADYCLKRDLLNRLRESWGWNEEFVRQLERVDFWKMAQVREFYQEVYQALFTSYQALLRFSVRHGIEYAITSDDAGILSRKLYAAFDLYPGKILVMHTSFSNSMEERNLTFIQPSKNSLCRQGWHLYTTTPEDIGILNMRPVYIAPRLCEVVTWATLNGLMCRRTSSFVISHESMVTPLKLKQLSKDVNRMLRPKLFRVNERSLQRTRELRGCVIVLNLEEDPTAMISNRMLDIDIGSALCCGRQRICLVGSVDLVLINSWGEVRAIAMPNGEEGVVELFATMLRIIGNSIGPDNDYISPEHKRRVKEEGDDVGLDISNIFKLIEVCSYASAYSDLIKYDMELTMRQVINCISSSNSSEFTFDVGRNSYVARSDGRRGVMINSKGVLASEEFDIRVLSRYGMRPEFSMQVPAVVDRYATVGIVQYFFTAVSKGKWDIYIINERNEVSIYKNYEGSRAALVNAINRFYTSQTQTNGQEAKKEHFNHFNLPQYFVLSKDQSTLHPFTIRNVD